MDKHEEHKQATLPLFLYQSGPATQKMEDTTLPETKPPLLVRAKDYLFPPLPTPNNKVGPTPPRHSG